MVVLLWKKYLWNIVNATATLLLLQNKHNSLLNLLNSEFIKANLTCSENRGPTAKILGPSFARIMEEENTQTDVLSLVGKLTEEDQGKDLEVKVKLFFLLQNMDNQLLSKCLKEISE